VLFGGLDTPVSLAIVPIVNQEKIPFMGPWAAGTPITKNGANPNYVFRVSANDDYVDRFLSRYAIEVLKKGKPGLLLENTPWGQSNETGLTKWFGEKGIKAVGVERFNWGDPDMSPQLLRLKNAGADHIVLVANAPEGAQVLRSKAKLGWDTAMISHWGISGGRFAELTGDLRLQEAVSRLEAVEAAPLLVLRSEHAHEDRRLREVGGRLHAGHRHEADPRIFQVRHGIGEDLPDRLVDLPSTLSARQGRPPPARCEGARSPATRGSERRRRAGSAARRARVLRTPRRASSAATGRGDPPLPRKHRSARAAALSRI